MSEEARVVYICTGYSELPEWEGEEPDLYAEIAATNQNIALMEFCKGRERIYHPKVVGRNDTKQHR